MIKAFMKLNPSGIFTVIFERIIFTLKALENCSHIFYAHFSDQKLNKLLPKGIVVLTKLSGTFSKCL